MPAINDNAVVDVTTEEGRRQRLEQLRGEARNAAYEVGKAVTRSAIAQGAMRDLGDLTNFMAGAASAGSLHRPPKPLWPPARRIRFTAPMPRCCRAGAKC
ncbi:MAG: hypothetical protein NVV72_01200 [Asticcacaulis sp.]|nr:hypothetical protein [Asticcacaulis sp.]